ncbi:MAG: TAXI family TRAP transporter solute-binding subunit [Deltaproteobacteria bacterium]|jgi:TRAP transporter TAXI family solute receptor|nr:TAXI family TRAP transporter solute-binding subunit [Deltaproteobacteria bacterium]MBW2518862.1 TAXI family TRAP transporter solute-binding subunit [Deltaproteobacteria bacterium]
MSLVSRFTLIHLLIAFVLTSPSGNVLAFDEPMLSISTGNVTGVYYAAGSAIAKMHNKKRQDYNLRLLAEASEGSVANIQNVLDGTTAFGIAQANALFFAKEGERFWKDSPQANLRAVFGLYTEDYTIIAAADAGIQSLADLKGKTVNIGEMGSTDAFQAAGVFAYLGLDPEQDLTISERPTYEASELLQAGEIDAYLYTVGHPNLSIKETSSGDRKVKLISPGEKMINEIADQRPYLVPTEIPIDYYPNILNQEPIPTIGVRAIFFTRADIDENVVYHIVKQVYENFDLFTRQHPALAKLTPQDLVNGLIVPIHPGAERFFREKNLLP